MKKIIYSLLFIFTVVFTACEEDLPKASFDLYELKSLTATAGDMNVTLSWEAYENARPNEYLILWTSGSSEAEGGEGQLLNKMKTFWEYLAPGADRKLLKAIHKSGTFQKYNQAVLSFFGQR